MKIAIATKDSLVCANLEDCGEFTIFEVDDDNQISSSGLLISENKHDFITAMRNWRVNIILAGNIDKEIIKLLLNNDIEVCRGCHGYVREVAEAFLHGDLIDAEGVCQGHQHDHANKCHNH